MLRFEIKGSPISVAYGVDFPLNNVFLSVTDERIAYDPDASDEVNETASSFCTVSDAGNYLDLHVGDFEFGKKVSKQTMRVYMLCYGIPADEIDKCFQMHARGFEISPPSESTNAIQGPCLVCQEITKKNLRCMQGDFLLQ
jgi:hypothetical protein